MSDAVNVAHTPGPWHWVIDDASMATLGVGQDPGMGDPHVLSVSPCSSCGERATEWKWGRCLTPNEADARLISAAPDLLEACLLARHICEDGNALQQQIDAAIAKATEPK